MGEVSRLKNNLVVITGFGLLAFALLARGLVTPGTLIYNLDISYFYTLEVLLERSVAEGRYFFPWNPFWGLGMPGMAEPQTMLFYPPLLLLRWLPPAATLNWAGFFHLWFLAVSFYWLGRELNMSTPAAVFAAIAFTYSGIMIPRITAGHLGFVFGIAWLPTLLILYRRLLTTPSWRYFLGSAAIVAMLILAGHPQLSLIIMLICATYFIYFGITQYRQNKVIKAIVLQFGVSLALGFVAIALTAIQLLPTAELYLQSARAEGIPYEEATALSFTIAHIFMLITPYLFTNLPSVDMLTVVQASTHPLKFPFDQTFYPELSGFAGVSTLVLAVVSLPSKNQRHFKVYLVALAFLGLILSLGQHTLVYRAVYAVSSFFRVPGRFIVMWVFPLCLLAGFGIDELSSRRSFSRIQYTLVCLSLTLAGILVWIFIQQPSLQPFARDLIILLVTLVVTVGILSSKLPVEMHRPWLAVGLIVLEMGFFAWPLITPLPLRSLFDPEDPRANLSLRPQEIRLEDGYRTSALYGIGAPEQNHAFQLQLLARIKELGLEGGYGTQILSVGYSVTNQALSDGILRQREQNVYLYETAENLPRIYAVSAIVLASDDNEAFEYVSNPENDLQVQAVIVATDGIDELRALDGSSPSEAVSIRYTSFEMSRITAEVETDSPVLIVFGEAFYPGWSAIINGIDKTIFQTNYAFRGVFVDAGQHQIEMVYRARWLRTGALISSLTFVGLLLITLSVRLTNLNERDTLT